MENGDNESVMHECHRQQGLCRSWFDRAMIVCKLQISTAHGLFISVLSSACRLPHALRDGSVMLCVSAINS